MDNRSESMRANILHEAVERLRSGESRDTLLASYGDDADWLEPLLDLTVQLRELRQGVPNTSAEVSLTRFIALAKQIAPDVPEPRRWPLPHFALLARLGGRVLTFRRASIAFGSLAMVLLLAWLALFQPWIGNQSPKPPVADFAVITGQGSRFSLDDNAGNIVVLYFAFPGCPTCRLEAPALGRIQEEFVHKDVLVVAINIESGISLNRWREYWKRIGAADVLWATDEDHSVTRKLGVTSTGTTIIVDRNSRIVFRDSGATTYETLWDAITKILNEVIRPIPETGIGKFG